MLINDVLKIRGTGVLTRARVWYLLVIKEMCDELTWVTPSQVARETGKDLNVCCTMMMRLWRWGWLDKGGRGLYRVSEKALRALRKLGFLEEEVNK